MSNPEITIKRLVVGLAALCLAAVPLAAQHAIEEIERRTEPAARALGPSVGLTLVGTVKEIGDDHLVLNTLVGRQLVRQGEAHFPPDLSVGDRVAVDYHRTAHGVLIATQLRTFAPGEPFVTAGTVLEITGSEIVVQTEVGRERFTFDDPAVVEGIQVGDQVIINVTPGPEGELMVAVIEPFEAEALVTTGTVVEITDQELVLRTDVGVERFQIAEAQLPPGLQVGDRVTVELLVGPEDVVVENVVVVPPDEVAVSPPPPSPPVQDPVLEEPAVLPATGSAMPWLALFGFLGLLAAGALRLARAL